MKRLAGCCILKIECFCFNEGISDSEHNRNCRISKKKKKKIRHLQMLLFLGMIWPKMNCITVAG